MRESARDRLVSAGRSHGASGAQFSRDGHFVGFSFEGERPRWARSSWNVVAFRKIEDLGTPRATPYYLPHRQTKIGRQLGRLIDAAEAEAMESRHVAA